MTFTSLVNDIFSAICSYTKVMKADKLKLMSTNFITRVILQPMQYNMQCNTFTGLKTSHSQHRIVLIQFILGRYQIPRLRLLCRDFGVESVRRAQHHLAVTSDAFAIPSDIDLAAVARLKP